MLAKTGARSTWAAGPGSEQRTAMRTRIGDLTLLDRQTGTLLLSDLLFVERVPSLDGSLKRVACGVGELKSIGADGVG